MQNTAEGLRRPKAALVEFLSRGPPSPSEVENRGILTLKGLEKFEKSAPYLVCPCLFRACKKRIQGSSPKNGGVVLEPVKTFLNFRVILRARFLSHAMYVENYFLLKFVENILNNIIKLSLVICI